MSLVLDDNAPFGALGLSDEGAPSVEAVIALHEAMSLEKAVTVFEQLYFAGDTDNYWLLYRMCEIYTALNRLDGAFHCAIRAIQLEPRAPNYHPYRALYQYFRQKGLEREAVAAFLLHIKVMPENPIVALDDVIPLLRKIGHPLAAVRELPDCSTTTVHHLEDASIVGAMRELYYGMSLPLSLRSFLAPVTLPPVDVVEIRDATITIYKNNLVISTADDFIFEDLSICELPRIIHQHVADLADVSRRSVDTATVILDRFPTPNLCHFLLDQITRLQLYARLGTDPSEATVIGPAHTAAFQKEILSHLGVTDYVAADGVMVMHARRLLVSKTCRATFFHPAQGGAHWATGYLRQAFPAYAGATAHKIYISRSDVTWRKISNEGAVIGRLEKAGFTTIVASKMSFLQQVEYFRNATHVVSVHGAGLSNIVFCPEGAKVLEIFHPRYGTWAYALLATQLGLDYRPLMGSDAVSDDLWYNDPDFKDPDRPDSMVADRNIHVDIALLDQWLVDIEHEV